MNSSRMDVPARRISIHTPARGVTLYQRALGSKYTISIHTPARGVTFPVIVS